MFGVLCAFLSLLILSAGVYWYALGVPGRSHQGALPPLTSEEADLAKLLRQHVTAIASEPHNILQNFANLEAAAQYIEKTLAAEGYRVIPQPYEVDGRVVRNLEVIIEPANVDKGLQTIVVGAHYDSARYTPGANDNASGTAAVIELSRLLKDIRPKRTRLRLVLFVNEEPPYFKTENMGSYRYARMLAERHEPVTAMMTPETIGWFRDEPGSQRYPWPLSLFLPDKANFVAFVGMLKSRSLVHKVVGSFRRHTAFPSIGGVAPSIIPGIDWSDHWGFAQFGFPAIMITDTAIFRYPHYHQPADTPDKVNYEHLARITKGIERVLREMAE